MAWDVGEGAGEAQDCVIDVTRQVRAQGRWWSLLCSILLSAGFKLAGKDNWALFIGQWPPTFLILAVFHKVLRPSR